MDNNLISKFLSAIALLMLFGCDSPIEIIDKPIVFDAHRIALTKEYLQDRYQLTGDSITIKPKMIVLHHTVIPTFQETFEAFDPVTLPNWRPEIENVSGLSLDEFFKQYIFQPLNMYSSYKVSYPLHALCILPWDSAHSITPADRSSR